MPAYDTVAVIGAGVMGHALALVHALGGCKVRLNDRSSDRLDWAKGRITALSEDLAALGIADPVDLAAAADRIRYVTDLAEAVRDTNLVVEAIIEDADIKRAFYETLLPVLPEAAVVASNTSFLDVFPLMPEALRRRALIVHWYTPPYLIDLVDVVPAPGLAPEMARTMVDFLTALGKKPVLLKKFVPGYIANNVQMAIEAEVFRLLDAGVAEVAEIDDAIRFGLAQRLCLMGQFKKIDYTGLQVVRDIHAAGLYEPPSMPTGTPKLDELLTEDATGLLSGCGFYDYGEQSAETFLNRRDRKLVRLKQALADDDEPL
ncbi:3-hydroxyacyl-CoA dehydrogenase family protein [Ruegeria jejuensis]|uniref:3-hydroxyacyl-CoA dehydrogenase family protein n=1 Tax=Ruegeria jejuensis TaxID=3233338 RepID=UPI00355B8DA3